MFICKKHYKQLMKEFEKSNPPEAVKGVLENQNIAYNMIGSMGEPFTIHVKPYLKKIKILDASRFEFRMPIPEFDLEPSKPTIGWKAYNEFLKNQVAE